MRLFEIDTSIEGYANLLTLLNFLRQRAHQEGLVGRITFKGLQTMLTNIGTSVDYESFKDYYDTKDELKNLIKTFDRDSITLQPYGDEDDQVDQTDSMNSDEPSLNKVDTMAKRALKKRS